MKRIWKQFLLSLSIVIVFLVIWQWKWVSYGWMQLSGGANVILKARSVTEMMADSSVPDSLKAKLRFVEEIRRFAVDSLGLTDTPNYQSYYDQHGQPICYILTVAEKYQMKSVDFSFPLIGSFEYKGFFDLQRAKEEQKQWTNYDTDIDPVAAYSTLGYFHDPILSSMLELPAGKLASLLIHEMTHSTLFIKNNHEFNENLANFIGDYGAVRFLAQRFGTQSKEYRTYTEGKVFREKYIRHFNRGTHLLDSLYQSFAPQLSSTQKAQRKIQLIQQIISSTDSLYHDLPAVRKRRWTTLPNNAFFVGFSTYNSQRNEFENTFKKKFNSDFKRYLTFLKAQHPSL
ncbi:MAG: aminopeptidase [Siphonobacter sp.]